MLRIFYTLLFYLLTPVIFLRLWSRGRVSPEYRKRWYERLAFRLPNVDSNDDNAQNFIWVHAVSVGETLAALPLCQSLVKQYPSYQLLVTTTTPTGSERVKAALGSSVIHCYLPYDLPGALRRFFKHFNPKILIIMETELWPNLIAKCTQQSVPILLANARLSDRSTRGYLKFAKLTRPMIQKIDQIAAQTREDANNFLKLGANLNQVSISGNIKYDLSIEPDLLDNSIFMREKVFGKDCQVWIAASTHQGEDEKILDIHRRVLEHCPNSKLIVVPRHPERFQAVIETCQATHLNCIQRTNLASANGQADILIGDSMGELLHYYAMADVAFVGGSLVEKGGHNILEPAALGIPCIVGLHTFNFTEATQKLIDVGAAIQTDEGEMPRAICLWLEDDQTRQQAGNNGQALVIKNKGALNQLLNLVKQLLKD